MSSISTNRDRPFQFSTRSLLLLLAVFVLAAAMARLGLISHVRSSASDSQGLLVGLLGILVGFAVGQIIATVPRARETMLLVSAMLLVLTLAGRMGRAGGAHHGDDLWFIFCAACGIFCGCLNHLWRTSRGRHILIDLNGPTIRRQDASHESAGPKLVHHDSNQDQDNDRFR